jgi:hypothetical protein
MQVIDCDDEYPYTVPVCKGSGMSTYMLQYMMGDCEKRNDILSKYKCKTCMYYRKNEDICIKYSPCFIVDTKENDDCDEWEEKKNG